MNHMRGRCPVCYELINAKHWREHPNHYEQWQAKLAKLARYGHAREQTCTVCGTVAYSTCATTSTSYCSNACRQKAYRLRRAAEVTT